MISLLACGLACPLGPADIAAPALAAGLARAERLPWAPELGVGAEAAPAVGHAVLADGDHGERCARLLELARGELGPCTPDAVLLCRPLPDPLRFGPDGPPPLPADDTFALGHAGAAAAVLRAAELIAAGRRRVLVAAVDSLLDPDSLAWLAADDRLRGPETPDGVCPGEAAACWLLGPADPAARAQVSAGFTAAGSRAPAVVAARWAGCGSAAGTPWTDATGEPWRDRAWGHLAHRLGLAGEVAPAASWGDLGAAALLAMGCVATRPATLWGLSDDGAAGAISLR